MIRGATKGSYFGPMVFGSKFMEHTLVQRVRVLVQVQVQAQIQVQLTTVT
jgi:hypothetical protein